MEDKRAMMTAEEIKMLWRRLTQESNPRSLPVDTHYIVELIKVIQDRDGMIAFLQGLISDLKSESSAYSVGMEEGVKWVMEYLRKERPIVTFNSREVLQMLPDGNTVERSREMSRQPIEESDIMGILMAFKERES